MYTIFSLTEKFNSDVKPHEKILIWQKYIAKLYSDIKLKYHIVLHLYLIILTIKISDSSEND